MIGFISPEEFAHKQDMLSMQRESFLREVNGLLDSIDEQSLVTLCKIFVDLTAEGGERRASLLLGEMLGILRIKYKYCRCGDLHKESEHDSNSLLLDK